MNVILLIAISITVVVETLEQLMFKASAKYENFRHHFLICGIVLHVVQILSWFFVLALIPLNKAIIALAATYITIALASKYIFKEQVSKRGWIGIIAIVAGLTLITSTGL
jgi:drug/metabolite transporter (DMT)-like permease